MPRSLVQMPNTVTIDNETSVPVDIAGLAALAADESGKVVDLNLIDGFDGHHSRRQAFWNSLAGLQEAGTITFISTPTLEPSFDYDAIDGPGYGEEGSDGLALRPGLPGYVGDTVRPEISGVVVAAGTVSIDVTFSEGVYSAADPAGPVEATDFVLSNYADGAGTLTALALSGVATNNSDGALVGGETVIRLGLDVTGTADANGTFDLAAAAGAIIDNKGNGAVETAEVGIATVAP